MLCIDFGVWSPGGSSVGLVLPMMLVLLHPPAGEVLIRRTPGPPAGVFSWAAARSAGTSCGLRHSTAQHSATPGPVGGGRLLLGRACWMENGRRRGMCLSCRRDWRAAGGNPGRAKAGFEDRVESSRIESSRAGFEDLRRPSRTKEVEGQNWAAVVVTGCCCCCCCCRGSLCSSGRSPQGGQQRPVVLVAQGRTEAERGFVSSRNG